MRGSARASSISIIPLHLGLPDLVGDKRMGEEIRLIRLGRASAAASMSVWPSLPALSRSGMFVIS